MSDVEFKAIIEDEVKENKDDFVAVKCKCGNELKWDCEGWKFNVLELNVEVTCPKCDRMTEIKTSTD